MSEASKRGWAVVTGASAGLGVEFARQLAAKGYDLVLTARRRDRLEALARDLEAAHRVRTLVVEADLGSREGPRALVAALDSSAIVPSLLVNNAGFGIHGLAIELPADRSLEMIDLNVRALVDLSLALGAKMAARGSGAILNVASTASFQPDPYFAVYGATKAFVLSFSQALAYELAPRGVHVVTHCPGPTRTEFFDVGAVHVNLNDGMMMSAERCVAIGLRAVESRRRLVVTGWLNALGALLSRLSPFWAVVPVSAWLMRPAKKALPASK